MIKIYSIGGSVFCGSTIFGSYLASFLQKSAFLGELCLLDREYNRYRVNDSAFCMRREVTPKLASYVPSQYHQILDLYAASGSFTDLFLDIKRLGYSSVVEDSKHSDWPSYLTRSIKSCPHLQVIPLILYRHPLSWVKSYRKAVKSASPIDAIMRTYVPEYLQLIANWEHFGLNPIVIDFDYFTANPVNVLSEVARISGDQRRDTAADISCESLRMQPCLGGNIRAYLSTVELKDFLFDKQGNVSCSNMLRLVNQFYPYLSEDHNNELAADILSGISMYKALSPARVFSSQEASSLRTQYFGRCLPVLESCLDSLGDFFRKRTHLVGESSF